MSFVVEVSHQIAELFSPARATTLTVVFRSTMRPGTIEELVLLISRTGANSILILRDAWWHK
jgi:GDP-mannose 6-dehydrogenase